MENNNTNILPWLHSIKVRTGDNIVELVSHTQSIQKRINSMLNTWTSRVNTLKESELINSLDIIDIRNRIGVYSILHPIDSRRNTATNSNPILWQKLNLLEGPLQRALIQGSKEGNVWMDYFGEDDGITEEGGWVVVSLSDIGIEYLNGIWNKVVSSV